MKNIYEILDEIEAANSRKARMDVIGSNLSKVLTEVFELAFHPKYQWFFSEMPRGYKIVNIPGGMGYCQLSTEIRKLYMFQRGNEIAEKFRSKRFRTDDTQFAFIDKFFELQ